MNNALDLRLQTIESHLAHLEYQLDQINQVVIGQGKAIVRLQAHLRKVSETVETVEIDRIKSTPARPPHSR